MKHGANTPQLELLLIAARQPHAIEHRATLSCFAKRNTQRIAPAIARLRHPFGDVANNRVARPHRLIPKMRPPAGKSSLPHPAIHANGKPINIQRFVTKAIFDTHTHLPCCASDDPGPKDTACGVGRTAREIQKSKTEVRGPRSERARAGINPAPTSTGSTQDGGPSVRDPSVRDPSVRASELSAKLLLA
jgi:hypothetical protein